MACVSTVPPCVNMALIDSISPHTTRKVCGSLYTKLWLNYLASPSDPPVFRGLQRGALVEQEWAQSLGRTGFPSWLASASFPQLLLPRHQQTGYFPLCRGFRSSCDIHCITGADISPCEEDPRTYYRSWPPKKHQTLWPSPGSQCDQTAINTPRAPNNSLRHRLHRRRRPLFYTNHQLPGRFYAAR